MEEYNFTTMPYTIIKYKSDSRHFRGVITEEQINKLINDMKPWKGVVYQKLQKIIRFKKLVYI